MSKPLHKIRAGQVSCAIWENEITKASGQKTMVLKASIERRFKDSATGDWRSSSSFSRNEVPLAMYCLSKAFEYMVEERSLGDNES